MLVLDFLASGETPICLANAAKLLPAKPSGKYVSVRTLERYIREGYGPPDAKVFLEGARIGYTPVTSREALQRFVRACSLADQQRHELPKSAGKKVASKPTRRRDANTESALREVQAGGWARQPVASPAT